MVAWREFRETGLWHEVHLHLRSKHQLGFGGPLDETKDWGIGVNRLTTSDCGPCEREIARVVQPLKCFQVKSAAD